MSDEALILLERCYDLPQAHMIRGLLETNNIPCFLMDENHTAVAWHLGVALGGARVMVHQSDFNRAKQLLADLVNVKNESEERPYLKSSPLRNTANLFLGLFGLFFSGLPLVMPDRERKK